MGNCPEGECMSWDMFYITLKVEAPNYLKDNEGKENSDVMVFRTILLNQIYDKIKVEQIVLFQSLSFSGGLKWHFIFFGWRHAKANLHFKRWKTCSHHKMENWN